ncbi:Tim44 domain-containing protein [Roseomonas hellenica]|uniref:Tim44 domain-containing protein n=1 Tax=Plastoroseomonas hellenica TaxID=2687306 RepID=A0ABS5EXN4_9PROT|nr:Tim44/TimA family putative adaptor protein [Plastoroseomonas hellenica]MBR0665038.1 Tim44 domain-containing protein [Plastoroseomonas hellenica]
MQGGFPIELILFAMVALFLVLRLRSVLGRRQGFERQQQPEQPAPAYDPRGARSAEVDPSLPPPPTGTRLGIPDPNTNVGQALARIRAAEPGFDPAGFLAGAEGAFRMIVTAFAAGDRATLRSLLSDDTYAGFESAIAAREQAGETQRTEVRGLHEIAIDNAELKDRTASVTVRFVSDQVNLTLARDGSIATGAEAVVELNDVWTFQRETGSGDPTWKLVATGAG